MPLSEDTKLGNAHTSPQLRGHNEDELEVQQLVNEGLLDLFLELLESPMGVREGGALENNGAETLRGGLPVRGGSIGITLEEVSSGFTRSIETLTAGGDQLEV